MRLPHPDDERWLWLIALAILLLACVAVKADDEPRRPALIIGVHSGSPDWHRVRSEISRSEWLTDAFEVTLCDADFRDVRYRYSPGDVWKAWPKPAESRLSAFATSGLAIEWARPELTSYVAGIAQDRFMAHWNLPIEVAPVEDDHVAPVPAGELPVPPDADLPRGE